MFKAIGAVVCGLAALLGVGYLIIRKQENQGLRVKVDDYASKAIHAVKDGATKAQDFMKEVMTSKPVDIQGETAA